MFECELKWNVILTDNGGRPGTKSLDPWPGLKCKFGLVGIRRKTLLSSFAEARLLHSSFLDLVFSIEPFDFEELVSLPLFKEAFVDSNIVPVSFIVVSSTINEFKRSVIWLIWKYEWLLLSTSFNSVITSFNNEIPSPIN